MVSQPIWIVIVIVAFFIGIGASYAHFANTYDPMSMKFQNQQLFDQMMSNNLKMSQQWMDSGMTNQQMMNDPEQMNQWMNIMMQNPQQMQTMIMNNMHDSDQMQMMEDMMDDMMQRMQTDPELEQAMMKHMANMKASRDVMMGNVTGMMESNMMGQGMMNP